MNPPHLRGLRWEVAFAAAASSAAARSRVTAATRATAEPLVGALQAAHEPLNQPETCGQASGSSVAAEACRGVQMGTPAGKDEVQWWGRTAGAPTVTWRLDERPTPL